MGDTRDMKSALIVRGGWEGHQPKETSDLFIPFLESHGFDVRVEESTAIYADETFMAKVDLIVQVITFGALTEAESDGLERAVVAGAGFAGWHGGVLASFPLAEKYLHMIGAIFVSHPGKPAVERVSEPSDWFIPHTYSFTEKGRNHEITRGISDFELDTEQYWVLHDPYLEILANTTQKARPGDPWHEDVKSPAVWTRLWGAGKIFVITCGHDLEVVKDQRVEQIIQRGMLWATRNDS